MTSDFFDDMHEQMWELGVPHLMVFGVPGTEITYVYGNLHVKNDYLLALNAIHIHMCKQNID